jgi:hypothetical protein
MATIQDSPPQRLADQSPAPKIATYDPLRFCIFTTVALLAWLLGPLAVLGFSGLGFWAYASARRKGLLRSKCLLRDTRLTMAYLGAAFLIAGWFTAGNIMNLLP